MRGDRTRQEGAGGGRMGQDIEADRQTDRVMFGWWQKVSARSIRTDVPVRELFSFFAFLWHM